MKIVDKINAAIAEKRTFFSFEFFPPRTDDVRAAGRPPGRREGRGGGRGPQPRAAAAAAAFR